MSSVTPLEATTPPTSRPFVFIGSAGEYFRIWIVNLCLTVLTLGLYAPWAKVRNRRYFYANLVLDGSSFDYDADPRRILVGRLIVAAFLGVYGLSDLFSPLLSGVLGLALMFLFPWAAVRSTAFHHRHSLYRNIRFGFQARYGEAFWVLILGPFLVALTLGLAYPWWQGRRQAFVAANSRYGRSDFRFDWQAARYYAAWARASAWLLGFVLVLGGVVLGVRGIPTLAAETSGARAALLLVAAASFVPLALAYGVAQAGVTNLLYDQSQLASLGFRSELRGGRLAWLYVSSVLGIVLSLGLLVPWARVRLVRYRAECLSLLAGEDLEEFAQSAAPMSGLGEVASEAADVFDFDLGL